MSSGIGGARNTRRGLRVAWGALAVALLALWGGPAAWAQDDVVSLILQLLEDKDKDLRALAFEQIRTEAKGQAATLKFADMLPKLAPDAQVGLLNALAARGDPAAGNAVRTLLADSDVAAVKLAAIEALGYVGGADDTSLLFVYLATGSAAEQKAAKASLIRLPGEDVPEAIVANMPNGDTERRVALIEVLAARRAGVPVFVKAAVDGEARIRAAAMTALGQLGGPEDIPGIVAGVLAAKPGSERVAAERATAQVCQRIADASQQAAPLLDAMKELSAAQQIVLLPAVGRVGGPAALAEAEKAFGSTNAELHAAGLAALCNWPDGSIGTRLLQIARTEEHAEHREMALKALIRVAPLPDARSDARRLDLVRTVLAMCQTDADRNLVLQRAKSIRTLETARFVATFLDQPKHAQQACETVVELAHHRGLREPNKVEFDRWLDRVIEISQDATIVDRAQRYKKDQTWVRPKAE